MGSRPVWMRRTAAAMCVWVVSIAAAGTTSGAAHPVGRSLQAVAPADEGADPPEPFRRVCVRCHTSDRVVEGRRFRSQWNELIEQMIARGAMGSDEDFDAVLAYLVSEFGRVNVNIASAAEFAPVLHIERSEADAIVAYRKQNGKFADFDALMAMPGAPAEKLRKRRDALFF